MFSSSLSEDAEVMCMELQTLNDIMLSWTFPSYHCNNNAFHVSTLSLRYSSKWI